MPARTEKCTEFQMHAGKKGARNIIDFTEKKLIHYATKTKDPQQKMVLIALIEEYRNGNVAIAWRRGQPVPLRVTKEK